MSRHKNYLTVYDITYCPLCIDSNLEHLEFVGMSLNPEDDWKAYQCPNCSTKFTASELLECYNYDEEEHKYV